MTSEPLSPLDLRLLLRKHGYAPLPATGKMVNVKGWPKMPVSQKAIHEAAKTYASHTNTGLRCNHLCAIDVDITDEELGERVLHSARRILGEEGAVRVGKAPKFLLLFRREGEGDGRKGMSGRYATPEDAETIRRGEKAPAHQVEALRGPGCQFIAYGVHPDTNEPYRWGGGDPSTTKRSELPAVSDDRVWEFLDECRAHFEAAGLVKVTRSISAYDEEFEKIFDLTDVTDVEVVSPTKWEGVWSVDDLETALAAEPDDFTVRVAGSAQHHTDSGLAGVSADGFLRVVDFSDSTVRMRPQLDRDKTVMPEALAEALKDERQAWLDELMANYAYVACEDACYHVRYTNQADALTKEALKTLTRRLTVDEVLVVNRWLQNKQSMRAAARMFNPRTAEHIFSIDGRSYLNTYTPPAWSEVEADESKLQLWHDFVGRLLPLDEEREMFLDWLANKVQRPWQRMFGVLMVADGVFGTGRGTLFSIISRLLGAAYVPEVKFPQFIGQGSQGQFYDWLYESLVVCVPEVYGKSNKYKDKEAAYERVKEVVDPGGGHSLHLPRKYAKAAVSGVYTSVLATTNHPDGLPIDVNDRRLLVLENGRKMSEAERVALHGSKAGAGWLSDDRALAALWRTLSEREVKTDLFNAPAMTRARRGMVEAGVSDLDDAWTEFAERVAVEGVATAAQFERYCLLLSRYSDFSPPDDLRRVLSAGGFLRSKRARCTRTERVRVGGGRQTRFYRWASGGALSLGEVATALMRVETELTAMTTAASAPLRAVSGAADRD